MALKILFIGGTGIISSACAQLTVEKGHELYLLTRGKSERSVPEGAKLIKADVNDSQEIKQLFARHTWDVVVDFIAYTPQQVKRDVQLFNGKTSQYIFISSASAYQKPPEHWPITEDTPLKNPFWQYSQNKIQCEDILMRAYREQDFPVTIVRPSHTYDARTIPLKGGYTNILRLKQGRPIILHGDGTSLWTLTHHLDFARGFVGLLGLPQAIGQVFHITSDEIMSWNQITEILVKAFAVPLNVVHIPSEILARYDEEWGGSLMGDKRFCLFFDNSKIKKFVPDFKAKISFINGADEMARWYRENPAKQKVDAYWDSLFDKILADWQDK